jgi:hypothetical protein
MTVTLTPERLALARQRRAVHPGPIRAMLNEQGAWLLTGLTSNMGIIRIGYGPGADKLALALAEAYNLLPALIDENAALRKALDAALADVRNTDAALSGLLDEAGELAAELAAYEQGAG